MSDNGCYISPRDREIINTPRFDEKAGITFKTFYDQVHFWNNVRSIMDEHVLDGGCDESDAVIIARKEWKDGKK
jgi:hypothetical protein